MSADDPSVPYGFCHCGCGEKTRISDRNDVSSGRVRGEPMRFISHHGRRRVAMAFLEEDEMDCWIWQRALSNSGYGQVTIGGRTRLAHRAYYEHYVGPIPEGLVIDHLCRNKRCVNPGHLEPVTPRENLMRGDTPAARNAAKTHCIHGHEFTEENTAIYPDGSRHCRTCERLKGRRRRQRSKGTR